jgi:hypothetical protein
MTCFPGTKVQILTHKTRTQFTCFTGTKKQILTQKALLACVSAAAHQILAATKVQILTQNAAQKYKY